MAEPEAEMTGDGQTVELLHEMAEGVGASVGATGTAARTAMATTAR